MAQIIETNYGTANQLMTITLTSLASAASRGSAAVDNSTTLFLDALVIVRSKTASGTIGGDKCLYVYAYGSVDGGTTYGGAATGTDAAITLASPPNVRLIGIVNMPASATQYDSSPLSVASAFGGNLPQKWGIIVNNATGLALSATGTDHVVQWQGVQAQAV